MHQTLPQLARQGYVTQLLVDGKPFLVLGGEIGNSSASYLPELEVKVDEPKQGIDSGLLGSFATL